LIRLIALRRRATSPFSTFPHVSTSHVFIGTPFYQFLIFSPNFHQNDANPGLELDGKLSSFPVDFKDFARNYSW
jgi:hypothetical protein